MWAKAKRCLPRNIPTVITNRNPKPKKKGANGRSVRAFLYPFVNFRSNLIETKEYSLCHRRYLHDAGIRCIKYGVKSKKKRLKFRILLAAVCFLIIVLAVFLHANITGVLKSIAEASMRSITTVAVNDAIYYTLSDQIRYEDLVSVEHDHEGNILAITSNALQINRIARDAAYMSQQNLQTMSEGGIEVPLGALTGIEAWAGFGPKINIKIIPISNVACRFVSKFDQAGINQTKHSIYLEIVADISIVMPSGTSNFASLTEVLICESVLVGKVPDTYLQADIFGDGFSLAPFE